MHIVFLSDTAPKRWKLSISIGDSHRTVSSRAASAHSPNSPPKCKAADRIHFQRDSSLHASMEEDPAALHMAGMWSLLLKGQIPRECMEFCCKWHLVSLVFQEAEFPVRIPKGQHSSTKRGGSQTLHSEPASARQFLESCCYGSYRRSKVWEPLRVSTLKRGRSL